MVDSRTRSDLPIKIGINFLNEDTIYLFDLIEEAMKRAISEYNTKLQFDLFEYDNTTNFNLNKIYVSVEHSDHGCKSQFDGHMGTLAHANTPGTRICLDIAENWQGDKVMLLKTLLHEMGHAIGLRHINNRPSIMTTYYNDIPDTLTDSDVRDINIMLDRKDVHYTNRINYRQTKK